MTDELAIARVNRAANNTDVRPVDLLRAMADDIEKGKIKVDGLVLLYANRPANSAWDYGAYRCGMTRDQELVTIVMAQERTIRNWREEG